MWLAAGMVAHASGLDRAEIAARFATGVEVATEQGSHAVARRICREAAALGIEL